MFTRGILLLMSILRCSSMPDHMIDTCSDGGRMYKPGERFISVDCSGSCVCGRDGGVSCVSLCPPKDIRCKMDEEKVPFSRSIANSTCKCPEWRCEKRKIIGFRSPAKMDVCVDGNNHYNPGEKFISADCTGRCTCFSGKKVGCESLCPTVKVICKPGEIKKQWSEQIPGSKCSCPRWICVKKAKEFCEFNGEKHKIGEYFVPKDCFGYCRCDGPEAIGCVSLCPPHGIYCTPGTRKVRTTIPVWPGRSNCTCPSWKCVKVKSMWYSWSNWTECNAKCGGGIRYRFRKCMENKICIGPSVETEVCNQSPCNPSYADAPCGALRTNSAKSGVWPRCDKQGYFEPLQCDPSKSQCWCVDRWGIIVPGSTSISHKPQCN
ncbi:SCO-spondin-like [Dendronephthya gigantea]|uniref:SCO-spondin-like n=1 Tax=Dendronephthya gigantea TaxID=151771 RepID=UPI00106C372C|nr:SCO-spondin-like [Dendronephthya gigantea]